MKTLFMLLIAATCTAQTVSQDKYSHHKVKEFITAQYPAAKALRILPLYDGVRASFKIDRYKYVASFSLKGNWIETEKCINLSDVPVSITQGISNSTYKTGKILSAKEITRPLQPTPVYMVEVRYNNYDDDKVASGNYKLYLSSQGELTHVEQEPANDLSQGIPWGGQ